MLPTEKLVWVDTDDGIEVKKRTRKTRASPPLILLEDFWNLAIPGTSDLGIDPQLPQLLVRGLVTTLRFDGVDDRIKMFQRLDSGGSPRR